MHDEIAEHAAQELVTNKKEILVNNSILQEGVAKKLRENPGNTKEPKGDKGDKGLKGDKGEKGPDGISPDVGQVATELVTNKEDELGKAVLEAKDNENKEILVNSSILQEGIAEKLRENPGNIKGPKGDKGEQGPQGPQGDPGQDGESPSAGAVATQLLTDSNNKNTLVTEVAGNQGLQNAVATNLKDDRNFKDSVKGNSGPRGPQGDPGPAGPRGQAGEAGESPSADAVAAQLLTGANKNTLITEVASNEDLQEAIAGNQVLKDAVTTALNSNNDFHNIVKRATIDSSTNANNAKQNFTLQKGEKLLDDVYEANIVSDDKTIATLPKIGYSCLIINWSCIIMLQKRRWLFPEIPII